MPSSVLSPAPELPETPRQSVLSPRSPVLSSPVTPAKPDPPVELYRMDDTTAIRNQIFSNVQLAVQERFPMENDRYRFELSNVKYSSDKPFSKAEQKRALLRQSSLNRKLTGRWRMIDKESGATIDDQQMTLANVPYFTDRGTFIKRGNEYGVAHQSRLKAGAYNRRRLSGELETHFNVLEGGRGFHVVMDPATKEFTVRVGGAKLKLFPILHAMGYTDKDLMSAWGKEVYEDNISTDDSHKRAITQFARGDDTKNLVDVFAGMRLDPRVTARTLGQEYDNITPQTLVAATQRLLSISRGESEEDDRDSIAYQKIMSPAALFAERISNDYDKRMRNMVWRSTNRGKLAVEPGIFSKQLDTVFTKSGLAQVLEETNLIENLDNMYKVLRTGEAGISTDGVPMESRNVQGSHLGLIDPIRGPESGAVGLDSRFTVNARMGSDGQLYTLMRNAAGEDVPVAAQDAASSFVAFPGEDRTSSHKVRAMTPGGHIQYVSPGDVNYWMKDASHMFSVGSNLVPLIASTLGPRLLMGGKFYNQALPLEHAEAPLVQALSDDGKTSFEQIYGDKLGVVRSTAKGRVIKVTDDEVHVQTSGGIEKFELYNHMPTNRKTFIHNTSVVKVGDHIKEGDLIAHSNMTDNKGAIALGKNLHVAYMPWDGMNTDDAAVISESAAKKMSSEHMFTTKIDTETHTLKDRTSFLSAYPSEYNEEQTTKIGPDGIIRPGMIVQKGDPLILAVTQRPVSSIHRGQKPGYMDASEIWDHDAPGLVTDVEQTTKGVRLSIKAYQPMGVGDKLSGRFGDKGVISQILPDGEMPTTADGEVLDVLLNPIGVVNRVNPSQIVETVLGKVAHLTGKPIKVPGFMNESVIEFAANKLKEAGISDTDELLDPSSNRHFRNIMTGRRFMMKQHHMSEDKEDSRSYGGYTAEGQPVRGGGGGAKQMGGMGITTLLSHGAHEVLKDAKAIRGQQNNDYWKAFQQGYTPPSPEVPMIYKKFRAHLIGAGINLSKHGDVEHLMALTDKDVEKLSSGEVRVPAGVDADDMKEIAGGLFDKTVTGGHNGNFWSHITLKEPLPNPVMEDPIRRMLGLTIPKFRDILSGKEMLNDRTGGEALLEGLKRIDLKAKRQAQEEIIRSGARSKRDEAIKLLRYIDGLERTGVSPRDLMVTKVPVIPPLFRPISSTDKFTIVSDANKLYVNLMKSNEALDEVKRELGERFSGDERLNLYDSYKAVTGLGDPVSPELTQQGVRGLLGHIFGSGSPKFGMFQRRVIGGSVDTSGRAVISPNSSLDMDTVGLPEDQAWELYKPMVMRRMTRRGMPPTIAVKNILDRTEAAREALIEEMDHRPILINRAPSLHKYNIMAVKPKLVKGHTLQLSPIIAGGFNADYDGDAMQIHVPVSEKAVQEAKDKMLPSRNLLSTSRFQAHYTPSQEFLHGLWLSSTKRSNREPVVFASIEHAVAAYRNGEVDVDDPVRIVSLTAKSRRK